MMRSSTMRSLHLISFLSGGVVHGYYVPRRPRLLSSSSRSGGSHSSLEASDSRSSPLLLARHNKAFVRLFAINGEDQEESQQKVLDEMTKRLFNGGLVPTNPFAPGGGLAGSSRPSKGDVYGEDELRKVLETHTELMRKQQQGNEDQPETTTTNYEQDELSPTDSLHDLVLQSISDIEASNNTAAASSSSTSTSSSTSNDWVLDEKVQNTISNICIIASDVDGTLLTSHQTLHPRTRQAIRRAVQVASASSSLTPDRESQQQEKWFIPATGKSRKGALDSLGMEDIGSLLSTVPGVFLQGLYCVNGTTVLFEQKLTHSAISACEELAQSTNVSIVGYDGDDLYSTKLTPPVVELHERYGEPKVQYIDKLSHHKNAMHKILLMDNDVHKLNTIVRPKLEALAPKYNASVTQAIPTMLEWIPANCSKALGVAKVCEALGIDPSTQLLAIGDAENDATMLQIAAIGVAVGNASPVAKEAADYVMAETNDEGGAGCAMELFGFCDQ